jgi:hypothetical protein
VITKKAVETSPLFEGDISYGSFNTVSPVLNIAYTGGKYAGLVSVSNISSDGDRDNSNFSNINSFFSGQYNMSNVSKLSLTGNIYGSKCGVPGSMSYPTLQNNQKDSNKYIQFDLITTIILMGQFVFLMSEDIYLII